MSSTGSWRCICALEDVLPDTGAAALLDGRQVALFRVGDAVYALDNYDPASDANVLARGIVGDLNGELVVASPVYKHHFCLLTGRCIEDAQQSVHAWPARIHDGQIWIKTTRTPLWQRRKLVVVGNGMAGMKVVEDLLALAPHAYDITVFGAEPHPNYNRVLLSPVLAGEKRFDDIVLHPLDWYRDRGVTLHLGEEVTTIDRVRRTVRSASGIEAPYDRLLLATGSNPVVLPVCGNDLTGVVTFRDIGDVHTMLEAAGPSRKAVVIGGGLLGLEAAHGLRRQGMSVTVVHLLDTLMERQLDRAAAALLRTSLEERGIAFHMPAKTTAILGGSDDRVRGVTFADGSFLDADLVVMAAGIRPNTDLARASGLRCDRGVLVDDTMQTFDPRIYAVGECVQHRNSTYGLVAPLFEQAKVCATHLAELGNGRYVGSTPSTHLKVTGIELFSAGDFHGGPASEALVLRDTKRGIYKRLLIENNKLQGAVLYGDTKDGSWYCELMTTGRDISSLRDKLLFGAAVASTGQSAS